MPKVSNGKVADGAKGNIETTEIMSKVARERSRHPLVRQLALKILLDRQIKSNYYLDEALAVGDYVKNKVRYVRDINGVETLHDPLTMIDQIRKGVAQGDCDDMSTLVASLLLSIGHSPFFRVVKYRPESSTWNHIYVVTYERNPRQDKMRVVLDAILKDKPIGTEIKHWQGKEIAI